jgi:ABC-type glycerol-3-phosphate transport system substrate-binding protein
MDNVLRASEIDGALYRTFPVFRVSTIIGDPAVVGSGPGWTLSEFKAVLDANPNADIPLGPTVSNESFLQTIYEHNKSRFVDWESGTVRFDNDEFIELLEFSNTFPSNQDTFEPTSRQEQIELITSGRQIMSGRYDGFLGSFVQLRTFFGGDIVFKGFPNENRDGNKFIFDGGVAITAGCTDKQGAWEFVRLYLTEEFQRTYMYGDRLSVNRNIFEESLENAMTTKQGLLISLDPLHIIEADELSQEEADSIMALVDSITGALEHDEILWTIISESASDFFRGHITAPEAATRIQSRASRYVSEMS